MTDIDALAEGRDEIVEDGEEAFIERIAQLLNEAENEAYGTAFAQPSLRQRTVAKALASRLAAHDVLAARPSPEPSASGLRAFERAWNTGLHGEFVRLVASALPSIDDHGNEATDVAEGMAEHFYAAFARLAPNPEAPEPSASGLREARERVRLRLHAILPHDKSGRDHKSDLNADCNSLARWIVDDVCAALAAAEDKR